jgi:hypothetical protein
LFSIDYKAPGPRIVKQRHGGIFLTIRGPLDSTGRLGLAAENFKPFYFSTPMLGDPGFGSR